jgi:putative spermidine/putrescine transport system substrate-binding protein
MLNRRYFLFAASSLTLSSLISGCSQDNALQIFFLQNSIPPQLIASFRKKFSKSRNLLLKPKTNLKELFTLLQTWQGKIKLKKKLKNFRFLLLILISKNNKLVI